MNEGIFVDNAHSSESSIHIIVLPIILWPISCQVWVPLCQPSRQFISSLFHSSSNQRFVEFASLHVIRLLDSSSLFQSYSGLYLVEFASFRLIQVVNSYHRSSIHPLVNILSSLPFASSELSIHFIALSIILWSISFQVCVLSHHPSRRFIASLFLSYSGQRLVEFSLRPFASSESSIHIIALPFILLSNLSNLHPPASSESLSHIIALSIKL